MRKLCLAVILILGIIYTCKAQIVYPRNYYNPLSGMVLINGSAGIDLGETDYKRTRAAFLSQASIEYFLPSQNHLDFSLRAFASDGFVSGKDTKINPPVFRTSIYSIGAGVGLAVAVNDKIFPYIDVGYSILWYYPRDQYGRTPQNYLAGEENNLTSTYSVELGTRFMFLKNWSANISTGIWAVTNDRLDNVIGGAYNDSYISFMAGISYYFETDSQ